MCMCVVSSNVYMDGPCQSNIQMSARSQSFPAEHCGVTRQSMSFTLTVGGFNIAAASCPLLYNQ